MGFKIILIVFILLRGATAFSQNFDGFKYISIEPQRYTDVKQDKWEIGSQVIAILKEKGLVVVEEGFYSEDACSILKCHLSHTEKDYKANTVKITIKDCNDQVVFKSSGSAKTITIKKDLSLATEQALAPLKKINYTYDPNLSPSYSEQLNEDGTSENLGHTDFSLLHFINAEKPWGTGYGVTYPTIQLNNTFIGETDPLSHLTYKLYSAGKLSIISRSDLCQTVQLQLEIKRGIEYYFQISHDRKVPCIVKLSKKEALKLLEEDEIKSTIELSEDVQNPIGTLKTTRDKQGTGFLINSEGYVLTNYHVIEDAKSIKIKGIKGDMSSTFSAKVVGIDIATDLALLQITSNLLSFDSVHYFNGNIDLQKGEDIYVLGYPLTQSMGEEVKITKGVINSLSGYKGDLSSIQLSAQVQPGNSGGPVFNDAGQLIGVINAKLSLADDVGYGIKMSYILNFLEQTGISFDVSEPSSNSNILNKIDEYSKCVYIIEASD